jgi:hypothetical protein
MRLVAAESSRTSAQVGQREEQGVTVGAVSSALGEVGPGT